MPLNRLLFVPLILSSLAGGEVASAVAAHTAASNTIGRVCFQPYPETEQQLIQRHFTRAIAVFSGEVRALTLERATLRVIRVWKGTLGAEVLLPTGIRDMGNGIISVVSESFTFKHGETYLLFGQGDTTDGMTVSVCQPNGVLKDSARRVAILDKLVKAAK